MVAVDDAPDPTALYRIRDGAYAADLLIAAVAEFDLFSWLDANGRTTSTDICSSLGLAQRPADVLLTLCAAHGLVERDVRAGDAVELSALGRTHLSAGSPFDLRAYYRSLAERPAVRELADVLRTDHQAAWASARPADTGSGDADWSGRLGDTSFAERITAAMDARGAFLAPRLAAAIRDLPIRAVLDVGGSSGIYATAVLETRPEARGTVFERPPVDVAARTLIDARGRAGRLDVVTGDMFVDNLPTGHDAHLYSQVLHDWDAARVEQLLTASFASLAPGGWLVDHDSHIDPDKCGPLPVAEYSVLLMHSTPGKCWSVGELAEMAERIGFVDVEHRPTVADRGALLARKPA